MGLNLHQDLIIKNYKLWKRKPLLHEIYIGFHELMAQHLSKLPDGKIVELGSGMGNIHETIPGCIRTELFPFPWIDQMENGYKLTFENNSVSDLLMVDVFHHLRYPGTALREFNRVLKPGGRLIMMEPGISLLGNLVYGPFHPEPIGTAGEIKWFAPEGWSPDALNYYSAQGNASRIFVQNHFSEQLNDWNTVGVKRLTAISYAASGGYSRPQLYPTFAYSFMKLIDKLLSPFPAIFTTRLLVVLENK